ncbi:beta-ketoacyl synthase N-terminal-like domain-containing protein, partial [Burkholderia sp. Ac-20379]|uniref:beta-ketoacyl synthase N-terminal-like domain-containing protein n=1 Tax=Burkholderia sp. Ac-20379 TaxID=2703900 RepID=UPI001981046B
AAGAPSLADLAYTLQVGREAMDARLAIEASDLAELAAGLRAWLDGRDHPGVHGGSARANRELLAPLAGDEDSVEMARRWIARGRLDKVLGLWVLGWDVDWQSLPRGVAPRIVGLPLYPFARERYWLTAAAAPTLERALSAVLDAPGAPPTRADLLAHHERLERELAALVRAQLHALAGAPLVPAYTAWRDAVDALLRQAGGADDPADPDRAWQAWEAYRRDAEAHGGPLAQIALAETTVRALPAILSGATQATAVMFPSGSLAQVERVYKENAVAARFSARLAEAVAAFVRHRREIDPAARLRVLEIGAGTGGTSEKVFAALADDRDALAEYRFTDVSRAFLIRAQRHYADAMPALRTALFDVERPLAGQDVEAGGYDLVIAANVLHATRDMRTTLDNVRATLKPGGLLLLNETSAATVFTHLTFGLLDGWWRFTDGARRIPGSPSLTPEGWRQVLADSGFATTGTTPEREHALGQQIIAAARMAVPGEAVVSASASALASVPQSATSATSATSAASAASGHTAARAVPQAARPAASRAAGGSGLRGTILRALGETLNVAPESIDLRTPFADYGLDSILGAELLAKLRPALGIELAVTLLFDYSTVLQLEAGLADALAQRGMAIPDDAAERPAPEAEAVHAAAQVHDAHDAHDTGATPSAGSADAEARASASTGEPPPAARAASAPHVREPIAIVGMSGRFAQSADVDELWAHLLNGRDLVTPATRFDLDTPYRDAAPGTVCRAGSFLDDVARFDALFFGISGLEATYMDPQQRLFLEEAWKALEHAGHAGEDMAGRRCGVFVGCSAGDYQELFRTQPPGQAFWGNTSSLIPARIAYYLDFKGPAVAVDTACSSSLVALHLACQSLWSGDSEIALAGGVFVQSSPRFFLYANQANMLSPSGRCAAFGEGADGIVPGEAVAALVLRPLSQALADGDTVLGVIAASGTNQDGTTNGITAPSALSQERLIRRLYDDAGIDPLSIGMMEAHGTGTVLGDPIEHTALTRAFGADTGQRGFCALGSIKANLGHATTAAGVAGVVKILLALGHRTLPPAIHVGRGNPAIDMAASPFFMNAQAQPWPAHDAPRRAAISSFGFSGTNAHAVIEEAPRQAHVPAALPAYLVVLSARSEAVLRRQAERLLARLERDPALACGDLAFTLLAGRKHCQHRLAVVVRDAAELAAHLRGWLNAAPDSAVRVAALDERDPHDGVLPDSPGSLLIERLADGAGGDSQAYRQALSDLAGCYLAGERLPYGTLFGTHRMRRIPLPTYPFEGKRYWVDGASPKAGETSKPAVEAGATSAAGAALGAVAAAASGTASKLASDTVSEAASKTLSEAISKGVSEVASKIASEAASEAATPAVEPDPARSRHDPAVAAPVVAQPEAAATPSRVRLA